MLLAILKSGIVSPGAHIGVAVSGGADSVALLRALHAVAGGENWTLHVLHVNHRLRGAESDEDAGFVQALSAKLGLFCKIEELAVPELGNLEENARSLRNAWFEAQKNELACIALGHTRSDQAETVLFRFLRGSGTAGLAGIRPVLPNGFVRPLLDVTREDARTYLRAIGQPWREDSSNRDLSFDRNRIRLKLLPLLARDWNPAIEHTLADTAEWARAEEEHWESILDALAREHFQPGPGPAIVAPAAAFTSLSVAAARRLIRRAIALTRANLRSVEFAHVESIRSLIAQSEGSGRLQIPGVDVLRSFDWVRFAAPGTYSGERHVSLNVQAPGEYTLNPGGPALTLQVEDADYRYNDDVNRFDAERVSGDLVLRTWQPGDRYRPEARSTEIKLKTLFQDERIPLWDRRPWPVLTAGSDIVWSRRFGVSAQHAVQPGVTRRAVTICERHLNNKLTVSPKLESGTGRSTSIG